MIIFAVFLRASEVGCFWAADGTGIRGWLAEEERNREEKRKEKLAGEGELELDF